MIVMPAYSTGWFCHCLARETGKLGHLYSPGHQRGPWPWFPYALDNGAFTCWNPKDNTFDLAKWETMEAAWRRLLFWAQTNRQKPMWVIVPDRPGDWEETVRRWKTFSMEVIGAGFAPAVAVQNGATPESVRLLNPAPSVIAVGGTTDWKWETAEMWTKNFKRVHVLRCNSPEKLHWMKEIGVESTDGTGWNRGNRKQTEGMENFVRGLMCKSIFGNLAPYTCRAEIKKSRQMPGQPVQQTFA